MPPRSTPLRPVPSGGGRRKAAKKRKPSEFARIYGSKERISFVNMLGCVASGYFVSPCEGRMENAHTATGGTGRKADADTIVGLCTRHHRILHDMGQQTFGRMFRLDLSALAAATEAAWMAHTGDSRSLASARLETENG